MALSFDKAFGVHQHTISVRAKRAEVLSSNIANADTRASKPGISILLRHCRRLSRIRVLVWQRPAKSTLP